MKKRRKLNRGAAVVGAGMSQFGMFRVPMFRNIGTTLNPEPRTLNP